MDDVAYFIAFCVEAYKNAHGLSGAESSRILTDGGVTEFLASNYEPLHTQSPQFILSEIEEYLSTNSVRK